LDVTIDNTPIPDVKMAVKNHKITPGLKKAQEVWCIAEHHQSDLQRSQRLQSKFRQSQMMMETDNEGLIRKTFKQHIEAQ